MDTSSLGKLYSDGEVIIRQGEQCDCMYVIQEGEVEVIAELEDGEMPIAIRKAGEFIGEMAIFDRELRSATVRARGPARLLTVDKRNFLSRVHEDPSLAFRLVETMSFRIRELQAQLTELRSEIDGSGA